MALCLWERQDQTWISSHFIIEMKATIAVGLRTVLVMHLVMSQYYRLVCNIYSFDLQMAKVKKDKNIKLGILPVNFLKERSHNILLVGSLNVSLIGPIYKILTANRKWYQKLLKQVIIQQVSGVPK